MTITPAYRDENQLLHLGRGYGSSGHLWLGHIAELAGAIGARSLIDYGAGKGTLGRYVKPHGLKYFPFDPVTFPEPVKKAADLLVSLDVLEHIEPECLVDTLDEMVALTGGLILLVIATGPSTKTLSDGRNAHLIQQDWRWWQKRLDRPDRWQTARLRQRPGIIEWVGYRAKSSPITAYQIKEIRGQL